MRKFRQVIKMMAVVLVITLVLVMAAALCSCSTMVLEEDPDAMQPKTEVTYVDAQSANPSTAAGSEAL